MFPRLPVYQFIFDNIESNLKLHGDKVWLTMYDTGASLKFSEIIPQSRRIAAALHQRGFGRGQVLSIFSCNKVEYFPVTFAAWICGGAVNPINPKAITGDLMKQFNRSQSVFVFCDEKSVSMTKEACKVCPTVQEVIVFGQAEGCTPFEQLIQCDETSCPENVDYDLDHDLIYLPYSSGTTGLPKGVMHTHRSVLATICLNNAGYKLNHLNSLNTNVFFHVSGFFAAISYLFRHDTNLTFEFCNEEKLPFILEELQTKYLVTYPTTVRQLINSDLENRNLALEVIITGGGPVPEQTTSILKKKIPSFKKLILVYGMTETLILTKPGLKPNSVGTTLPTVEMKVVDPESGKTLSANEQGELCFRSPTNMMGYHNQPEATKHTIRDGWIHSGDVGYFDEEGYVFITSRMKELLKYDSYQVAPAALEAILLQHPAVVDAVVIGQPDDIHGELPLAFIIPKKNLDVDLNDVRSFVDERVADHEKLRGGIRFIDDIPRNNTGKVLRRYIIQQLKDDAIEL